MKESNIRISILLMELLLVTAKLVSMLFSGYDFWISLQLLQFCSSFGKKYCG